MCEPGSNKCTMRKPRLPPARSLEITECKPHGQHSHRFIDTIQKPAMTLLCGVLCLSSALMWVLVAGHLREWGPVDWHNASSEDELDPFRYGSVAKELSVLD